MGARILSRNPYGDEVEEYDGFEELLLHIERWFGYPEVEKAREAKARGEKRVTIEDDGDYLIRAYWD